MQRRVQDNSGGLTEIRNRLITDFNDFLVPAEFRKTASKVSRFYLQLSVARKFRSHEFFFPSFQNCVLSIG